MRPDFPSVDLDGFSIEENSLERYILGTVFDGNIKTGSKALIPCQDTVSAVWCVASTVHRPLWVFPL